MILKRQNMSENKWNHFKIVPLLTQSLSTVNCQLSIRRSRQIPISQFPTENGEADSPFVSRIPPFLPDVSLTGDRKCDKVSGNEINGGTAYAHAENEKSGAPDGGL